MAGQPSTALQSAAAAIEAVVVAVPSAVQKMALVLQLPFQRSNNRAGALLLQPLVLQLLPMVACWWEKTIAALVLCPTLS
jgi:hypothetical protein